MSLDRHESCAEALERLLNFHDDVLDNGQKSDIERACRALRGQPEPMGALEAKEFLVACLNVFLAEHCKQEDARLKVEEAVAVMDATWVVQ